MKHSLLILLLLSFFSFTKAQGEFITVWKPSNVSTQNISGGIPSTSSQIWFPGTGNNFNVTWEEVGFPAHNGTLSNVNSAVHFLIDFGNPENPVPANATYRVKIRNGNGSFNAVKFPSIFVILPSDSPPIVNEYAGDAKKITDVSQWGNTSWTTMEFAFFNCSFMDVSATDVPDLSNVSNTEAMFFTTNLTGNNSFAAWETSNITTMAYMFGHTPFNQPIGSWNVSNVTDIRWMFHGCNNFNQPLKNWNTSNMINMDHTFHYCNTFNQDISNWDTSNVTKMRLFLGAATIFNQNLGDWNLKSIVDGKQMLSGTALSCINWDKTLYGWANNPESPVNFDLGNVSAAVYSHPAAVVARNYLLNTKGWLFSGDIYNPMCESVLATEETKWKDHISIYPNPAKDFIYLKNVRADRYTIFDLNGRIVLRGKVNDDKIDVKNLQNGMYFLQIENKYNVRNLQFLKK
jgi:surface protein